MNISRSLSHSHNGERIDSDTHSAVLSVTLSGVGQLNLAATLGPWLTSVVGAPRAATLCKHPSIHLHKQLTDALALALAGDRVSM